MLLMTLPTTSMFSRTYCSRVKSDPGVSSTGWGRGGGYGSREGPLARVHSHPVELVLRGEGVVWGVQRTGRAPCHAVLRPGSLQVCQSAWGKVKLEFWISSIWKNMGCGAQNNTLRSNTYFRDQTPSTMTAKILAVATSLWAWFLKKLSHWYSNWCLTRNSNLEWGLQFLQCFF